jgi:glycosyltransferase involved in cell wall biosynthesis
MAGLRPPERIVTVYTSDATPTVYKRSEIGAAFGSYLSASRLLDPLILAAERRTFRSLDLLLWPTAWLKSGADALYGLSDAQSHVVPWGANVADPGVGSPAPRIGRDAPLRLLLLGRDWFTKGGPTAFDTMMALRATGVNCKLDVIGTTPPEFHRNAHVALHGVLDKSKPAEIARFETVLRGAHFLIQPSVESFGFAFCEAAAYGLPALCLRQGGIPVREGVNGHALPPDATPSDFAKLIEGYLDAPDRYADLRARSRQEYEARLNWDAWGRRVADLIAEQRAIKERGSEA